MPRRRQGRPAIHTGAILNKHHLIQPAVEVGMTLDTIHLRCDGIKVIFFNQDNKRQT